MAVNLDRDQWLTRLIKAHDSDLPELKRLDAYYEGHQTLAYMAPELMRELNQRLRQLVINWPRLCVDALEERLDVEGFRFSDDAEADSELWGIWQANDLDEESQLGHVDALALRRSFVIVGANEGDEANPLITVESPLEVYAERDPRTREVVASVKRWEEDVPNAESIKHATLYLPGLTTWYVKKDGTYIPDPDIPPDHTGLDRPPVEPLVNRARVRDRGGVSELADIIPVSDALCKIATDMMVSAEYHAIPRRWAAGMTEEDFVAPDGTKTSTLSARIGAMWLSENVETKFGQFAEADLKNFHDTIDTLARVVGGLTGLPPHFLGYVGGEPVSADAIRASEARLVKRAERRQRAFGGSWERVMRLAMQIRNGSVPANAARLETIWRNAATPTLAQTSDAVAKLHAENLLPDEMAWEMMGFSQTQIARMLDMQQRQADRNLGSEFSALIGAQRQPAAPGPEAPVPPAPAPIPQIP
jgi:hypothetical protein